MNNLISKNINVRNRLNGILKDFYFNIIDIGIFILCIIWIMTNNETENIRITGVFVILISIYILLKVRNNKKILLIFSVISFINISIGYSDMFNLGLNVAEWQIPLRMSVYNIYSSNSVLLFLSTINIFLSVNWIKKSVSIATDFKGIKKNNVYISVGILILLYIILFMGYDPSVKNSSEYISNQNPLYEYSIIFFLLGWIYSGKEKILIYNYYFFGALYIGYSLYFGDRSAAFIMILLLFILCDMVKKINIIKLFPIILLALMLSNFIAGYRTGVPLDLVLIMNNLMERGLYSDTVSYSYYASITVSALYHFEPSAFKYFIDFIIYQLIGFGINEFGNMADYVSNNYTILFNRSGGLFTSSFYAWFGYKGIILSAITLGMVLRSVFSKRTLLCEYYQILIIVFVLRWYLYNPTALFRTIFVVGTILFLITVLINMLTRKKCK